MRGWQTELLAAAVAVAIGTIAQFSHAQTASAPVVLSGDAALDGSGAPLGLNFATINVPFTATPGSGNVAAIGFQASLAGAPAGADEGIWAGLPGSLRLSGREGDPAPGIPGSAFNIFSRPQVDGTGRVAFWASFDGSVANHGIWAGMPGNVSLIARTGMIAPGFGSGTFTQLADGDRALISPGQVAFRAFVNGSGISSNNDSGIFISSASLQLAVREGSLAAGTAGAIWKDFVQAGSTPVINASGQVVFRNTLDLGDTTLTNAEGIWITTTSTTSLIVRADDFIAGGGSPKFASFSTQPSLNNAGTVAYRATLQSGGGVSSSNDSGIWVDSAFASPTLVAREGSTAPTVSGPSAQFDSLSDNASVGRAIINSGGKVAFIAPLTGPETSNQGIFVGASEASLAIIARKGQPAPGTGGGATFQQFDTNFTINSGGQVAFAAAVSGLGGGNDSGIWAVDPWNDVVAVAVEGSTLDTGGGEKTISSASGLGMTGNSTEVEGRSAGFTDTGILSFSASFTDGSTGVFNARVGGTSRVKANAPTLGPAVSNSFFTSGAGLAQNTVGAVSGDIGYLRFQGFAVDATNNFNIFLDFVGANIAGAIAELNRGANVHGYTVTNTNAGAFDVIVVYAGANDGSSKFFYWNFSNIDNVDLVNVMVTPEPGSVLALCGALAVMARRRRT